MTALMLLVASAAAATTCEAIGQFDECIEVVGGIVYTAWSEEGSYDRDERILMTVVLALVKMIGTRRRPGAAPPAGSPPVGPWAGRSPTHPLSRHLT